MLRRRLAIAGTVVALALGTVGVGSAGAGPSDENRLCNLWSVQSFMAYFWGTEVNHGRCMKYFRQGGCRVVFFDEDGRYDIECISTYQF